MSNLGLTDLDQIDLGTLTPEEKRELVELLAKQDLKQRRNQLDQYRPYPKQIEFHTAGKDVRERLFMAGNQLGKTVAGSMEVAIHATGRYPTWWRGYRFPRATRWIVGSESSELTKKGVQRLLLGQPELKESWGTGAIPHDAIKSTTPRAGVPDAVAAIVVKHISGEDSVIQLSSYEQGRSKWQADTVDGVWFDEEPPLALYSEGLTRTQATGGIVMVTFTPLLGMSDVVKRFIKDKQPGTIVVQMTIDDAPHYTPEERERIIAGYPEHEREARSKGVPMIGDGRVFPVAESAIAVQPFPIPPHWARGVGLDFGYDHPAAAVWMAHDRDTDTIYVYDCWRDRRTTPAEHALAIRAKGDWIPVAWPHDGLAHDKGSGVQLAKNYEKNGVNMMRERATFEDGTNGVEAGLMQLLERMQDGRFKVFRHLNMWFEEFRMYYRKEGQVVKIDDDLMAATRYAFMMRRKFLTNAEASVRNNNAGQLVLPGFGMLDPEVGY